jgi:hypothetical protein
VPGTTAAPTGNASLCQGTIGNSFTTTGAQYATQYSWQITPASAGTFGISEATTTLDLDAAFTGDATITVQGTNPCGNGQVSQELPVTVNALAPVPIKPTGIDSVDVNHVTSSDFTTTPVSGDATYQWIISPENAGAISGTGLTGSVTWNSGFRGIASVSVAAVNLCGPGEASEPKSVKVYSTLGIDSHGDFGVTVYPNPTTGLFTFTITTGGRTTMNIHVLNSLGTVVMEEKGVTVTGNFSKTFDLTQLSSGVYFFKVEGDAGMVMKKIVIER